ncbi:MAG: YcgL domain-containing protein [Dokdonella sp.]
MQSFVYKSVRKADTYVFLRESERFDVLPAALAETLGELQFVIEVELEPQRELAREDVGVVMANLTERGFHLQVPPPLVPLSDT